MACGGSAKGVSTEQSSLVDNETERTNTWPARSLMLNFSPLASCPKSHMLISMPTVRLSS